MLAAIVLGCDFLITSGQLFVTYRLINLLMKPDKLKQCSLALLQLHSLVHYWHFCNLSDCNHCEL